MIRRFLYITLLFFSITISAQREFSVQIISDSIFQVMKGNSFPEGCAIKRSDLRYLRVLHVDIEGKIHLGELVCNKAIANDLLCIFKELYQARYPIEKMQLIDNYDADDELSMQANNTSCFCYRVVKGSKHLSKHSQGLAIDINPLYNPCVKGKRIQPVTAARYANRTLQFSYKIERGDLLWRLFTQHGFKWGGAWRSLKDWQHFER